MGWEQAAGSLTRTACQPHCPGPYGPCHALWPSDVLPSQMLSNRAITGGALCVFAGGNVDVSGSSFSDNKAIDDIPAVELDK